MINVCVILITTIQLFTVFVIQFVSLIDVLNGMQKVMNTKSYENAAGDEKNLRPQSEHAPKCPRCDSENTKFCYYNNYSLSQPRYFCKSCRRYWTKGGTLRNVPIGGGCRKNKRSGKRSLDRIDLLLQSQMENSSNVLLGISSTDHQSVVMNKAANFSNLSSSSLSYESLGNGDSLSVAFARLQKQCDVGGCHLGLGFGFDHQNFVQAPIFANLTTSDVLEKRTNLGFLSSCSESQPTSSNFNTQMISSLYNNNSNNGLFENGGDENYEHTDSQRQPLMGYEDQLSCIDLMSTGGRSVKQDMLCETDNRTILREFPWQMGVNDNENGGCLSSLENDYLNFNNNNLVLGSSSVGNESAAAAATSWTNLMNTSVLM